MNTTREMELIAIDRLVPYQNNARTHSADQISKLRSSLREFGFVNPILIDKDMNVLAGHGRIEAAKLEGIREVPCVFVDYLSPAQKKAYILADNRMALDAGWDQDLLAIELEGLKDLGFDLALSGFDEEELADLFDKDETREDEFDIDSELEKPAFTRAGDIWMLNEHRLICGDSTKTETLQLLMQDKKANLVVTDPPYAVGYEGKAGTIKNDSMTEDEFYAFLLSAFQNMNQAMADDASIYVFHSDIHGLTFRKAFFDAGFYLSGCCIWKKNSFVISHSPYHWIHEPVLYGWKAKGRHKWFGDRRQSTIWEFDRPARNKQHPTMKPVPLVGYPIKNSSMQNAIVLDPFGGSGSTLIACQQIGRICYMCELEEKFCDVIIKRFIEECGSSDHVTCIRDGKEYRYEDIANG